MTVTDCCNAITEWFSEHLPEFLVGLQPPVTDEEWESFCHRIGEPLPEDQRQLYAWHNGEDDTREEAGIFYGQSLASLDRATSEWLSWGGVIDRRIPGAPRLEAEGDYPLFFNE